MSLDELELRRQASRERTVAQIRAGLAGQQGAHDGPPRATSDPDADSRAIAARVLGIAACEIHPYPPPAGEGGPAGPAPGPGGPAGAARSTHPELCPDLAPTLGRSEDPLDPAVGAVVGAVLGLVGWLAALVLLVYAVTGSLWIRVP